MDSRTKTQIWLLIVVSVFLALSFGSCSEGADTASVVFPKGGLEEPAPPPDTSTSPNDVKTKWLIPASEIWDGGPGKDGIYALVNPPFEPLSSASYLHEDDLILGLVEGSTVRAYPHRILDWHEIVNDKIDRKWIAVTYCPFTGSGVGFNASLTLNELTMGSGRDPTFGVSGFLWNNNLIPYDRPTDSNWSQMLLWCVNGRLRGEVARPVPLIETTWATWKKMFPNSVVLSDQTGFERPYQIFPYGIYKTDPFLLFPISVDDKRLPRKVRAHGIIIDPIARVAKAYPVQSFDGQIKAINDDVSGLPVVVAGSGPDNIIVSYSRRLSDQTVVEFTVKTESPSIYPFDLVDNEGTVWNILGEAVSGPRQGKQLAPTLSYNAYWFAWGAIFPGIALYGR